MAKPHITRTVGPIHFEDLDPHRFEDLATKRRPPGSAGEAVEV